MFFTVVFQGKDDSPIYSRNAEYFGTDKLDWLREKIGVDLPAERVDNYIRRHYSRRAECVLGEQEARVAGHFRLSPSVQITCSCDTRAAPLEMFVRMRPIVEKDKKTGEITMARIEAYLDKDVLVKTWLDAGAPLDWKVF